MVRCSLAVLSGAALLTLLPALPGSDIALAAFAVAIAGLGLPALRLPASALAGASAMGLAANAQLAERLDPAYAGVDLAISARIDGFPRQRAGQLQFVVRPDGRPDLPGRIRLTWFEPASLPAPGDTWRLHVRLRQPRGFSNPGGFDFEGWLFRERIGATGYVLGEKHNYRIGGSPVPFLDAVRRGLVGRIVATLPDGAARAAILAVAVGARHEVSREQWDRYAATGTSHLMAISGLHIGLAAGSAYFAVWIVLGPMAGRRNLRDAATVAAILTAAAYAALSGFAVPARRACLMVLVAGALAIRRRPVVARRVLAVAAIVIFAADPLSLLAPGFGLSFGAVAVLLLVGSRLVRPGPGGWRRLPVAASQLGVLQLALLAGLFPLTVGWFDRFTLLAPAVNMIAVPVFSFITVPSALAGMMLAGPAGEALLAVAHASLGLLIGMFGRAASLDGLTFELPCVPLWLTLLPLAWILLPPGWPGRRIAPLAIVAAICHQPARLPEGCVEYHALDVGQGQAVAVRTRNRTLLFDTGPSFRGGGNTADLVVIPFLQYYGIERLDKLVISHADLDHSGGTVSLLGELPVDELRTGEPLAFTGHTQLPCVAGNRWDWDGIEFVFLHPRSKGDWTGNNASCVIEVSAGDYRLLITGDIETPVEQLLAHRKLLRDVDVVFVPHHGSATSSSDHLVNATRPGMAVISASFSNRWDLPKPEVVERWDLAGARIVNTALSGAVSQRICREDGPGAVREWRRVDRTYWRAR